MRLNQCPCELQYATQLAPKQIHTPRLGYSQVSSLFAPRSRFCCTSQSAMSALSLMSHGMPVGAFGVRFGAEFECHHCT